MSPGPQPANLSKRRFVGVAREELPALLEALLLVSPEPAELRDLADAAGVSVSAVEDALTTLNDDPSRGGSLFGTGAPRTSPLHPDLRRMFAASSRLDREARLSERSARDARAHRVSAAGNSG